MVLRRAPTHTSSLAPGFLLLLASSAATGCFVMGALMFGVCQSDQVLWAIVGLIAIDVMHMLIRKQEAAIGLFPHQTMFTDIATIVGKMMAWHKDVNVSLVKHSATFPVTASRATCRLVMAANVELPIGGCRVTGGARWVEIRDDSTATTTTNGAVWYAARRGALPPIEIPASLPMARQVLRRLILVMRLGLNHLSAAASAQHQVAPFIGESVPR